MSRRGPRGLTAEEQLLWNKVKERTTALHHERPQTLARQFVCTKEPAGVDKPAQGIASFRIGERPSATALPHSFAAPLTDRLAAQPVRMDQKSFGRLKRGKLSPESRIDLHGLTLDQAHAALNRFVLDAQARGLRLILVITGKGKERADSGPIPTRRGVLKHQVPHWLNGPNLRPAVLQIAEAHLKHGGGGAYYVYLRRHR